MRFNQIITSLIIAAPIALACAPAAMAVESVPIEDLPDAVRQTAEASVEGLRLTAAEVYTEAGVTFYDIDGTVDGRHYNMEILADGRMLELERAMPVSEVPALVRTTAINRLPGLQLTGAEPYLEDGEEAFELEGTIDGVTYDIEVTASGAIVDIQQTVPLASLPANVREAIERALPGIALLEAERGVDDEAHIYAAEGIAYQRTYEVTVNDRGEILEIEIEHDLNEE